MLPKQAISHGQLLKEGHAKRQIESLSASLKIFPTPFKGIYYVPMPEERAGWFIEKPLKALSMALKLYLGTGEFYYGCETAEEFLGLKWSPSGRVHVVNAKRSGRINLAKRAERNARKASYRAGKIAALLGLYGREIIFHKIADISKSRTKQTPYGAFATKAQIAKDKKRFNEK